MTTGTTAKTEPRKMTKGEVQTIRRHLDALFPDSDPDTDLNTTFGPAWKDDVSRHPDQYPQVMQALSTALGTSSRQYSNPFKPQPNLSKPKGE